MLQWTHCVEGMCCMPGAMRDPALRRFDVGIGMPNAYADSASCCFGDEFLGAFEFRGDGHHPDISSGSLPKPFKCLDPWRQQILRRMHSAPSMTEERTFDVNADRLRPSFAFFCGLFNEVGQQF